VAYILDIPEHIEAYLDNLQVSQRVRDKIGNALEYIKNLPAEFRANAANRYPNSTLLRYGHLFMDEEGRTCCITFGIDDRPAIKGILRIPHARYKCGQRIFPTNDSSDS
jgi:hypothetical protein